MITGTSKDTITEGDFRLLEVLYNNLPYEIAGFVRGSCPDSGTNYGYTPPTGWFVSSCVMVDSGSHGASEGENVILIYCSPIDNTVDIDPSDISSVMYPTPSDNAEITGNVYSIPDGGFYIQQENYIRYAIYDHTLKEYGYVEGEKVIANVKLSAVYEDIIDVDQYGYVAQLISIRRYGEQPTEAAPDLTYLAPVAAGTAVTLAALGAYYVMKKRR